ncbi:reverse transcriptase domain-containing protein [Tanacetum coccineum]
MELHQIDTFYNSLTSTYQDSLNAAAGGNLLTKTPKDAVTLIENKSKVHTSQNRQVVAKVSTNTYTSGLSPDVAALTDAIKALLLKNTTPPLASVKAATMLQQNNKLENMLSNYFQMNKPSGSGLGPLPSNIVANPKEIVECLALADLGASINLMPLSIWRKLSLPELTRTQMILKLADRSTTRPTDIAKDVFVRVGNTSRALIDAYGDELTLWVSDEAITFKVGNTSRYSYNDAESINRIDVIDIAYEEYSQEVLGFSDNSESGNPTPISEPIIAKSSPSFTPFEGGEFILEEIETCFASDSVPPGIDDAEFDPKGDIRLIEEMLNNDPYSPLLPKDLKCEEFKSVKSSIDEMLERLAGNAFPVTLHGLNVRTISWE